MISLCLIAAAIGAVLGLLVGSVIAFFGGAT